MKENSDRGSSTEEIHSGPCGDLHDLPEVSPPLQELDLETGPYCTSAGAVPESLLLSIRRVGVLNPPLVHQNPEGGLDVVAGFRRLRALRILGLDFCICRDLSGTPCTPLELLLLGLYDNLATRPLNDGEKALALARLSDFVHRDVLIQEYMPLMGLAARRDLLDAYLALELADPLVREAVVEGALSMASFRALQTWSKENRLEVVYWIKKLNINFNKQSQFIDFLYDLMEIEACSAREILRSGSARMILEQGRANAPQATTRILEHLRKRRLPALAAAETAFRRNLTAIDLPPGVRVFHPPGFEGTGFRLEIAFRNGNELRSIVDRLAGQHGLESLGVPWKPME